MNGAVAALRECPTLRDGTPLADLFDLERRRIKGRVFSDPEIFELEMTRIFSRSWLLVGLESEIPNPGDYVVRPMGGNSVIVSRDRGGAVNVLLNRCTHRGTQLCVTDGGQAMRFRCPYHGWLFTPDGRLEAMPAERNWLGGGDKADYAMRKARVATRGGLIFATFDDDMPDFETYLGDFRFYFDMMFCALDDNLVSVGPPQRWSVPFNWKLGAENFVGDGYHLQTAHASLVDLGMVPGFSDVVAAFGAEPRWGHGFQALALDVPLPQEILLTWLPPEVIPQMARHLDETQLALVNQGSVPMVATLFPNMSWLTMPFFGAFLRVWHPVGPGEIELRTWVIAHPAADGPQRRVRMQGVNSTFGATGMFEQDDTAIWSRAQRAHQTFEGSRQWVSYACSNGAPSTDWPGPGPVWTGFNSDDHIWAFHLRWLHLMTGGEL